jgi:hypothetical protein
VGRFVEGGRKLEHQFAEDKEMWAKNRNKSDISGPIKSLEMRVH